jgi:uncharacterized protein YjbJ (UPF0337 family)
MPDHTALEPAMNWTIIERDWPGFKAELRAYWNRLTDEQLDRIAGKRIHLADGIQHAYGITSEAAERQIRSFEERNKEPRARSAR